MTCQQRCYNGSSACFTLQKQSEAKEDVYAGGFYSTTAAGTRQAAHIDTPTLWMSDKQ